MPPAQVSTRLSIAQTLLEEVQARLAKLPDTPAVAELRSQALECEFEIGGWAIEAPSAGAREAILRRILGLQAAIGDMTRRSSRPP